MSTPAAKRYHEFVAALDPAIAPSKSGILAILAAMRRANGVPGLSPQPTTRNVTWIYY